MKLVCHGFNHTRFFSKGGLKRSLSIEGVKWSDPHTVDKRSRKRVMTGVAESASAVHSLIVIVENYVG